MHDATNVVERQGDAAIALSRLRSLSGEWSGTFDWSGARSGSGTIGATYTVTGAGSAVIEHLLSEGVPMMTTAYHVDGADLRMTHFCAAQNQPRLKARRIDLSSGLLDFGFVDVTNLATPDAGHVNGLQLRFVDERHLVLVFQYTAAGERSTETIRLARTSRGVVTDPREEREQYV